MPAPSTLGTFLRAFTFGHVRQLDKLLGRVAGAGLAGGRRARRRPAGDRCRQLRRRGLRLPEAGRRLRLHQAVRLSPDPRHPRRHARGAAHPPAQGVGEHAEGDQALLRGADRPRRARRRDAAPSCCGPTRGSGTPRSSSCLEKAGWQYSIGVRNIKTVRAAVDGDRRGRLADDRLPRRRRGADRRDHLRRPAADRQAHPPDRRPSRAVARLAALRVRHQPHRATSRSSRPSTATTPSSSRSSPTSKTRRWRTSPPAHFHANGAWTVLAALAHNLLRWTQLLGLPDTTVRAARTLRRRLLQRPRPPDPPRARLDASPPRPLALARRLHQRAQPHPRAPRRRLTAGRAHRRQRRPLRPPGRDHRRPHKHHNASRRSVQHPAAADHDPRHDPARHTETAAPRFTSPSRPDRWIRA